MTWWGRRWGGEATLFDPGKCSLRMKDIIRQHSAKSAEHPSPILHLMNCAVFWADTPLTTTSHKQWNSVLRTTPSSCANLRPHRSGPSHV